MSEYWVSHKKYFCKYCNIYIADDAPSRRQHETGLKHKGNVERFVRSLYKAGEKRKQDLEEEKREIARIERAANAAFAQDVGSGLVKVGSSSAAGPSSSSAAAAGPKTAAVARPSNPYANYSTAESLGFIDPDAERAKAEAERRRTQGVAGEWQFVDVVPPPLQDEHDGGLEEGGEGGGEERKPVVDAAGEVRAGEKRPAEASVDEEDGRGWKLRRKVASVGLGELYDPGAVPIKLKPKKDEEMVQPSVPTTGGPSLGGSEKPKWSARGWNKPGASSSMTVPDVKTEEIGVKEEEDSPLGKLVDEPIPDEDGTAPVKTEEIKPEPVEAPPLAPAGGSLFKKRRAPVGGGSRGGRRI